MLKAKAHLATSAVLLLVSLQLIIDVALELMQPVIGIVNQFRVVAVNLALLRALGLCFLNLLLCRFVYLILDRFDNLIDIFLNIFRFQCLLDFLCHLLDFFFESRRPLLLQPLIVPAITLAFFNADFELSHLYNQLIMLGIVCLRRICNLLIQIIRLLIMFLLYLLDPISLLSNLPIGRLIDFLKFINLRICLHLVGFELLVLAQKALDLDVSSVAFLSPLFQTSLNQF